MPKKIFLCCMIATVYTLIINASDANQPAPLFDSLYQSLAVDMCDTHINALLLQRIGFTYIDPTHETTTLMCAAQHGNTHALLAIIPFVPAGYLQKTDIFGNNFLHYMIRTFSNVAEIYEIPQDATPAFITVAKTLFYDLHNILGTNYNEQHSPLFHLLEQRNNVGHIPFQMLVEIPHPIPRLPFSNPYLDIIQLTELAHGINSDLKKQIAYTIICTQYRNALLNLKKIVEQHPELDSSFIAKHRIITSAVESLFDYLQ